MTNPQSEQTRLAVIETKLNAHDDWRTRTDQTLSKIADTMQLLTRFNMQIEALTLQVREYREEERTARAAYALRSDAAVAALDLRISAMEAEMPALKQIKGGIFGAVSKASNYLLNIALGAGLAGALAYLGYIKGGGTP